MQKNMTEFLCSDVRLVKGPDATNAQDDGTGSGGMYPPGRKQEKITAEM